MAAAVRVATLPFRAVWRLFKLMVLPAGIVAVTWLFTGAASVWFFWTVLVCGVWALVLFNLWRVQIAGELRSLARGTVHISGGRSRRGGRR